MKSTSNSWRAAGSVATAIALIAAGGCTQIRYASKGMPLAKKETQSMKSNAISAQTAVARVVDAISPERVRADVDRLAAFGTRHTLSDTVSETRGIGAARRWLKAEMEKAAAESGGRMTVSFEEFDAPKSTRLPNGGRLVNVVGVLKGTEPAAEARRYYVVGHYDSRNLDPMDAVGDAPGANDDGSGTSAVIEIARVLAKEKLGATVVFLLTAGEEQGLIGAKYHAEEAKARGEKIAGVLSNDIIGDPMPAPGVEAKRRDREVRVFSEGIPRNPSAEELAQIRTLAMENDSPSRQLARFVAEIGDREGLPVRGVMVFRPDRFLRGGDHSAFLEAGFTAVRFTEFDENYDRQHQNVTEVTNADGTTRREGDVPEYVDAEYVANVARLNAAVLVHLANAPEGPKKVRVLTAQLSNDTEVAWEASEGAAGYEVVTRATTSAAWETSRDVGNVTRARLGVSKDDVFVGVRAYGNDGWKSPVVFATAAKE
jgi:Zn-dependent M28 family amino/carboxypeptidase